MSSPTSYNFSTVRKGLISEVLMNSETLTANQPFLAGTQAGYNRFKVILHKMPVRPTNNWQPHQLRAPPT